MSNLARKSVLSKKLQDNEILVIDNIVFDTFKTSDFINFMKSIKISGKRH